LESDNHFEPSRAELFEALGHPMMACTVDGKISMITYGNGEVQTYAYDSRDRLNYSSGPWTTVTYSYDQVGNRSTG